MSAIVGTLVTVSTVCNSTLQAVNTIKTTTSANQGFTAAQTAPVIRKLVTDGMAVDTMKNLEMHKRLIDFRSLTNNWNGNGARPFSEKLIKKSSDIFYMLPFKPDVFPTARNSIQFEYEKTNGAYLEFEIFEDHIGIYQILPDGKEREYSIKSGDKDEITKLVKGFYGFSN